MFKCGLQSKKEIIKILIFCYSNLTRHPYETNLLQWQRTWTPVFKPGATPLYNIPLTHENNCSWTSSVAFRSTLTQFCWISCQSQTAMKLLNMLPCLKIKGGTAFLKHWLLHSAIHIECVTSLAHTNNRIFLSSCFVGLIYSVRFPPFIPLQLLDELIKLIWPLVLNTGVSRDTFIRETASYTDPWRSRVKHLTFLAFLLAVNRPYPWFTTT